MAGLATGDEEEGDDDQKELENVHGEGRDAVGDCTIPASDPDDDEEGDTTAGGERGGRRRENGGLGVVEVLRPCDTVGDGLLSLLSLLHVSVSESGDGALVVGDVGEEGDGIGASSLMPPRRGNTPVREEYLRQVGACISGLFRGEVSTALGLRGRSVISRFNVGGVALGVKLNLRPAVVMNGTSACLVSAFSGSGVVAWVLVFRVGPNDVMVIRCPVPEMLITDPRTRLPIAVIVIERPPIMGLATVLISSMRRTTSTARSSSIILGWR